MYPAHPCRPARTGPDVAIWSAEFDLLRAIHPISFYEGRMTPAREAELRPAVLVHL